MTRRKPAAVTRLAPRGIWLGASVVRGRPCPVGEPYPHIHYRTITGCTGREVLLLPKECAACHAEKTKGKEAGSPE